MIQHGPLRQVWLLQHNVVSEPESFLVRDDAYSKGSATLGRTLRLGEPIDTGPVSAAYQTDWSGGREQNVFSDTSMFFDSDLDTTDPSGSVRMWPGFLPMTAGPAGQSYIGPVPGTSGADYANSKIVFARGTALWTTNPDGGSSFNFYTHTAGQNILSLASLSQTGGVTNSHVVFGTADGKLRYWDVTGGSGADISHPTTGDQKPVRSIVVFKNKLAVAMDNVLYTRDYTTVNTWVKVGELAQCNAIESMVVHGGSLYILGWSYGGRVQLHVSDGVSITLVHQWDNGWAGSGGKVLSHRGSLYVGVRQTSFDRSNTPSYRSVLYRYDGSSVKVIHDRRDVNMWPEVVPTDGTFGTWGKFICMAYRRGPSALERFNGTTTASVGVLLYNPENDSIHVGPSVSNLPSDTYINSINEELGNLYLCATNSNGCTILRLNRDGTTADGGFSATPTAGTGVDTTIASPKLIPKVRRLHSSVIDAGMPDQDKTWLRVNVKHNLRLGEPADEVRTPTLKVYVRVGKDPTDSSVTATLIGSYTPTTADASWKTSSFDIVGPGDIQFPKGTHIQYILELSTIVDGVIWNDRAVIESVSVEYMVSPAHRRFWRLRAVCDDDQPRLNGTPNPLNTREELAKRLEDFWLAGTPLKMWDATTDEGVPDPDEGYYSVMVTDWNENTYRHDDSTGTGVTTETALTLYEVGAGQGEGFYTPPFLPG